MTDNDPTHRPSGGGNAETGKATSSTHDSRLSRIRSADRFETVHELLKEVIRIHHEEVELVDDIPLPLDLGDDWIASTARRVINKLDSIANGATTAHALATIAYDISRSLHRHLCGTPNVGACRTDAKVASDYVFFISYILLQCNMIGSLDRQATHHLEAAHLDRDQVIGALEGVLVTILCAINDDRDPLDDLTGLPLIQLNTAVSNIGERDYLTLRTLTTQIRSVLEACNFTVEITSDYATPANKNGFVDEGRVRARIFRASVVIIFSRHAGDGASAAWTLCSELNIPTLVLRQPDELNTSSRFPGQMDGRELKVYETPDQAVELIGDFVERHRGRIETRFAYLRQLNDFSTEHLQQTMTQLDLDAFDNSMVTWERARFYTSSPVLWFQAHPSTTTEIRRVLGLDYRAPVAGHPDPATTGLAGTPDTDAEHGPHPASGMVADHETPDHDHGLSRAGASPGEGDDPRAGRPEPADEHSQNAAAGDFAGSDGAQPGAGDQSSSGYQPHKSGPTADRDNGSHTTNNFTGDRTGLSVESILSLLLAAETRGISFEDCHQVVTEWQRPGIKIPVSPRTSEPNFEGWCELIDRVWGT